MESVSATVLAYVWYNEGQERFFVLSDRSLGFGCDKRKTSIPLVGSPLKASEEVDKGEYEKPAGLDDILRSLPYFSFE